MPKRLVCPLCGARYEVGAAICRSCGAASDYRDPESDPAKGPLGETLLLFMLVTLLVGLTVVLIYL